MVEIFIGFTAMMSIVLFFYGMFAVLDRIFSNDKTVRMLTPAIIVFSVVLTVGLSWGVGKVIMYILK